jgi:hypothetical protein
MERESSKHGPRVDEEMAREARGLTEGAPTSGRAEESRDSEPSGDDQPSATIAPDSETDQSDHDALSHFASYLRRSAFPASAQALLVEAQTNNAPDDVIDALGQIPTDTQYRNPSEVWAAVTGEPVPRSDERF